MLHLENGVIGLFVLFPIRLADLEKQLEQLLQQVTTLRLGYIYIIHYPAKVASLDESTIKKNCIFFVLSSICITFE